MSKNTRKGEVKKLAIIVIAIMLLIAVIGGTYSKYTSTANGSGTVSIAKWAVKVNNQNMGTEAAEFTLNFTYDANTEVVANKIAPGRTARAYVDVDLTGTEVSVDFACALTEAATTNLNSTFGTGVVTATTGTPELQTGAANMTLNGTTVKVGTAAMSGVVRVPIIVTWNDVAANNVADTTAGMGQTSVTLPVTLTVSQKVASN